MGLMVSVIDIFQIKKLVRLLRTNHPEFYTKIGKPPEIFVGAVVELPKLFRLLFSDYHSFSDRRVLNLITHIRILSLAFIVFWCVLPTLLLLYSFLAFTSSGPFNSPDETANYFFAGRFASETSLQFYDPANDTADGLVSPRSMRVVLGKTVPAGFIGLPILYGLVAKAFGTGIIPFLTPFLAVVAIIFFYLLVKSVFDRNIAFVSSLLAFIFPGWWYYSAKGLMPNVAFVSFLIISLYFFLRSLDSKKLSHYLLFSVFLSFSLMVRTSEFIWIAVLLLAIVLLNLKKINWRYLITAFAVFLIVFSPIFFFNQANYGSPFSLGYSLNLELENKNLIGQSLTLAEKMVLPFGFHPKTALANFYDYTFGLFPVWSGFLLFGFLFSAIFLLATWKQAVLSEERKKKLLLYLGLFLLISAYLAVYYGSWNFHDNPDPEAVTIGTSYVRYWLPLYLFSLPFLGFAFSYHLKKYKLPSLVLGGLVFLVLSASSWNLVMEGKEEGIFRVRQNLIEYRQIADRVFAVTEPYSIIIAGRLDKAFFPGRRVIFKLNTETDYARIRELIEIGWPIYLFDFTLPQEGLDSINSRNFLPHNLVLEPSVSDFATQSLYPVKLR